MLDIKLIRSNPYYVALRLADRNGYVFDVAEFQRLDNTYKKITNDLQTKQAEYKALSGKFGAAKKKGEDTTALSVQIEKLDQEIKTLKPLEGVAEQARDAFLQTVPNLPYLSPDEAFIYSVLGEVDAHAAHRAEQNKISNALFDHVCTPIDDLVVWSATFDDLCAQIDDKPFATPFQDLFSEMLNK